MALCRWMRRRKCTCCCICKCILVAIIIFVSIPGYKIYRMGTCDTQNSKNLLKELCHLYHMNKIAGSMCHTICDEQKLTYEKCTNYRSGKKVIFMQCEDCEPGKKTRVVLKTKEELGKKESLQLPFEVNGGLVPHWLQTAREIFLQTVRFNFAINLSHVDDIFSFLWGENFDKFVSNAKYPNAHYVAVQTIHALTQQLEYTFYVLYKNRSFVPKIYGTCGPAYVVEYTPAVSTYESGFSDLSLPWNFRRRAEVALGILKLLKVLKYDLHQPLHLCDVKGDNFGVRENGEITLVDTDCATFHETLYTTFFSDNCSKHETCDFFDCHGYCDVSKGKCHQVRTNNNLQSVCEDVLIGGFSRFSAGLLRDPPRSIQLRLNKAIHECAYPGLHNERYVRRPAPDESWNKIVSILKEYLGEP